MEAEAVAFVVMNYFGVDIKSDEYLALYKESYDLMESFKRINDLSTEMIDYIISSSKKEEVKVEVQVG